MSKPEKKLFPFCFLQDQLPSVLLSDSIESKVFNHITKQDSDTIKFFEKLGESTIGGAVYLIRSLINYKKKNQKEEKTIAKILRQQTKDLRNTSLIIDDVISEDVVVYNERRWHNTLMDIIKIIPFLSLTPRKLLARKMLGNLPETYKAIKPEDPENQICLGEYCITHPRVKTGLEKILDLLKHSSNLAMYVGQTTMTGLAYSFAPEIISYPLITATATSGTFMIAKLIATKGRDSSGIICTALEYLGKFEKPSQ